jgi:hypothetical protein
VIALRTALRQLPPRARAAVALHYLAGLPVTEVARVMAISENTPKGHLKAGLAGLSGSGPGYSYDVDDRWLVVDNAAFSVLTLPHPPDTDQAWLASLVAALEATR